MFLIICLIATLIALLFVYIVGNNNERHWKKKGVKFYSKNKVTGVFWDFFTKDGAMFERFQELYEEYREEPAVGIGSIITPTVFVVNPKNIQHVLQTDFNSFYHRGMDVNEDNILANNLVFLNGPKWKLLRQNMSPLFTATKLKSMYYMMDKSAKDFVEYLQNNPKALKGDCYETLTTFCNASVCGAIFGITSESIFDSPFLDLARRANAPTFKNNIKFTIMAMSSKMTKFLNIQVFKEHEEFFIGAIKNVIMQREKENVKRHDFADICINIQKNGTMTDPTTGYQLEPTYEVLSAQAMFFLVAGVDPVAIVIFTTFVELGKHPDILEKVHQEIDELFENNDNVTYEDISQMKFLDKVITEAMRMNPPIGALIRECMKDSVLPVGNIKIEKGTKMFLPVYAIHHDPEYYEEPHVFNPERYADGTKLGDEIYLPFGLGNRMCLGARYSKIQIVSALVHVLRHFTLKVKNLGGGIKFYRHINNVRRIDVDVEFIPRSNRI